MQTENLQNAILACMVLADRPLTLFDLKRQLPATTTEECSAVVDAVIALTEARILEGGKAATFDYFISFKGREHIEKMLGMGLQAQSVIESLQAIQCPDCKHSAKLHADQYGCQHERGDGYLAGTGGETHVELALGPCHCTGGSDPIFKSVVEAIRKAGR